MWEKLAIAVKTRKSGNVTERPAGAFTVKDYAKKFGIAYDTARHRLRNLCCRGILESAAGKEEGVDGRVRVVVTYKIKEEVNE